MSEKFKEFFALAITLFFLFLCMYSQVVGYAAEATISQIQRTGETLEEEKALRDRLDRPEKRQVKKITVEGASLLEPHQIKEIILPFQGYWLAKVDIEQLLELIRQAYLQKGYTNQPDKISYQLKKKLLTIKVQESPSK